MGKKYAFTNKIIMLKNKINITLLLLLIIKTFYAQDTSKIVSRFRILESWHDGKDLTSFDQERKGELCIHYDQKNQLSLSNISVQSGSYSIGILTQLKKDTVVKNGKKNINSSYKWNYHNTYDKEKGVAKVNLIEEETNYGMSFKMELYLSNTNKIIYKGLKIESGNEYIIPKTIL